MSTVGSVSIIAITVAMGSAVLTAAGAAVTVHKTAVAADSAALAAAEAATGWIHADPCEIAAQVAAAYGAELRSCEIDELGDSRIKTSGRTVFGEVIRESHAGLGDNL
ncbi:Rv3654c family TadE-like protein [Leucobacter sp. OH1287]|uniref:Rv3654c family TadE-like protein n=1 Tax=Leucobacter sp. OH1287 TaxID=2491049 RepID=UPI000F5FEBD6|nr:Rv3654c family TadE-like protein [Leucobacter sp. OH1287]RRD61281.1 hypothetical protein EII30_02420 [Leucobacter sp. OH1287]